MIKHRDLERARSLVVRTARRNLPDKKAFDTTRSSVEAGLIVVGFDVAGAIKFTDDLAGKHYERIRYACTAVNGPNPINLFSAGIATGLIYGAQAERMRK